MDKLFGKLGIAFLISLTLLPSPYSFYVLTSSNCESCVVRLNIVKELYSNSTFIVYDVEETANINRFSEIQKVIDVPYIPLPIIGMFSNGELKLVAAGVLLSESWGRIVLNGSSGVNVYIDNGKGEAILQRNIGDDQKIKRLGELFLNKDVNPSLNDTDVSISLMLAAAFMDSINPCMLGFFLIFLAFISFSQSSRIAIRTSLAFGCGVFITRYLIGLGLMQVFWIIPAIRFLAAFLALVLGATKILQFFLGERRQIPSSFADQITRRIESTTNIKAGFVAGCITAFFIITCSSPPYFLALSLLSSGSNVIGGLMSLMVYNLVVISPLLLVSVCVYVLNLTTTLNLRLWISTRRKFFNLLIGVGLTLMSLFLILYQVQFSI